MHIGFHNQEKYPHPLLLPRAYSRERKKKKRLIKDRGAGCYLQTVRERNEEQQIGTLLVGYT